MLHIRPSLSDVDSAYNATDLERLFYVAFKQSHATVLLGGGDEPIYRAATPAELKQGKLHCIIFNRDYFASALHEVAHWCLAGPERRTQTDYGYWYVPDGRNAEQQQLFERVEVKPQALEWIFSKACGAGFKISADNINSDNINGGAVAISTDFKQAIAAQAQRWCDEGLPTRAAAFVRALCEFYNKPNPLQPALYLWQQL